VLNQFKLQQETMDYLKECLMRVINNADIKAKYKIANTGLDVAEKALIHMSFGD
jgi:hypothetical protein